MAMQTERKFSARIGGWTGDLDSRFVRFQSIRHMAYGHQRRTELMKLFNTGFECTVNIRGCINLRYDTDIKYLLKNKTLVLCNQVVSTGHFGMLKCKHSFVKLNPVPQTKPKKLKRRTK